MSGPRGESAVLSVGNALKGGTNVAIAKKTAKIVK